MLWPRFRLLQDCIAQGNPYVPTEEKLRKLKAEYTGESLNSFKLFEFYISKCEIVFDRGDSGSYAYAQWTIGKLNADEMEAYDYVVKT